MDDDSDFMQKSGLSTQSNQKRSQAPSQVGQGRGNFLIEVINTQSITVENMRFKDKEQWQENDYCAICELKFSTLKLNKQHHCRMCAQSVCKECSSKKVNEERVCDFCFLKCKDHKQAQRRKNDMKSAADQIEQLKENKKRYNENILDINNQIFLNQERLKEELKEFAIQEGELLKEEKKFQILTEQLDAENEKLRIESAKLEHKSAQNKTNISELTIQINKLKLDIDSVKSTIERKAQAISQTNALLQNIQNSESFRNLSFVQSNDNSLLAAPNANQQQQSNQTNNTIYMGYQMESILEGCEEEDA